MHHRQDRFVRLQAREEEHNPGSSQHREAELAVPAELRDRGKKRQIIGISIANRMITIGWIMQRKGELYNGSGDYSGLKQEGLEAIDCSSFLALQWWPPEFPNQDSGRIHPLIFQPSSAGSYNHAPRILHINQVQA